VSLSRGRSSLAVGNVVGAAISNILGAFSLGLLFRTRGNTIEFDKSSKIYSVLLLLLTTFVVPITFFARKDLWRPCGGILIGLFAIYVTSIVWAIGHGRITPPEASDSEGSDSDDDESRGSQEQARDPEVTRTSTVGQPETRLSIGIAPPTTHAPRAARLPGRTFHRLSYHISYLLLGFLSICLASYVLSHAASTITTQFKISDVMFGVIVLAIATTLPEKFIAVISGFRGHVGILVANTVGSNIFLLSLCMGIIMVDTEGSFDAGNVNATELGVMWGATAAFTATIWFGAKWSRVIGGLMLTSYIVFLVLEFTVIRKL